MSRWFLRAGLVVVGGWGALHCGSDDGPSGSAGGADAGAAHWGATACGKCVDVACGTALDACATDPTCAAHVRCVRECPPTPAGPADAGCTAACPSAQGTVAADLIEAYTACRSAGPGAACAECGGSNAGSDGGQAKHPLLDQQCPTSPETVPCFVCEDENCCESYLACKDDPVCDAFGQCMKSCTAVGGYAECVEMCDGMHQGGLDKYLERLACVSVRCETECAEGGNPCTRCVNRHCANAYVACEANEACARITLCIEKCTDGQCHEDCRNRFPGGLDDFDVLADCSLVSCVDECG